MADLRTLMLLICGDCGQRMKIPGNAMGKVYKCVKCGAHVKVQASNVSPLDGPDPAATSDAAEKPAEPLGQKLIQAGCINEEQLQAALAEQEKDGGRLFEILIRQEALSKDQLHDFLSKQSGIASIELSRFQIDRDLVALIPRELALEQLVLPIDRLGKLLTVAMACPLDMVTIASMEEHTGLKVKAMLCKYDDIHSAVQKFYPPEGSTGAERFTFQLPPGYGDAPATDLQQKVVAMEQLALCRDGVETLKQLCEARPPAPKKVVEAVMDDPLVAMAVLRAANSPLYGMPGDVDGIGMSVSLHGAEGLMALLVSLPAVPESPGMAALRIHAVATARTAGALAKSNGKLGRNMAYAAGLVHGLGRFALASLAADRYAPLAEVPPGLALAEAEEKTFKTNHLAAGATLAAAWDYPPGLQAAIQHYPAPKAAGEMAALAAVVGLAAFLSAAPDEVPEELVAEHLSILGLSLANARNTALSVQGP